ncbi:MAG: metal ABC transporter permease [Candidatus Magasanikbacteria bacterium CG11_big_fil_rev_8_21_14_0_20_39_34]|uniref:Metal ABC transporter permease n=1 Tax=Candidatus Magasanikbacteria bacterium CG11_big_fil_rev_8_21_14_0_20_39_34 TaxID=1974653 RepID=A0A2H0N664_9BACT|nr:MAG: metal ABC transporter permease [Candidatus Magasanikbacteria bacterium CG11_big_fil_rev_8_21_14_0_20_39_34]
MFLNIFQYSFVVRGLEAGIIVAIVAPLIGIFLVLRRYSLIADTLAHVSLAGIAIGLLLGFNPVFSAIITTLAASLGIEKLRNSRRIYGESALALFLSGSLALSIVLLGIAHGFNTNLFNYLFGSIVTVTQMDVWVMLILAVVVICLLALFYRQLVFVSFDEDAAKVNGISTKFMNTLLIFLAAITVSLSIPIVGVLLIAALIVVPVVTALQMRKSFLKTLLYAEIISLVSVISGIAFSFYFNLSTGGTIVLIMLAIFIVTFFSRRK